MRSPVPGQPVPASAIDRLTAMANGYARVNGGGTAEWASAVVTTRDKALTSAYPGYRGGAVLWNAETTVYLVTMKGHFISRRAAPGAKNPTGDYLSFVVNAEDCPTCWPTARSSRSNVLRASSRKTTL
jgi:hypothetical protein